MFRFHNLWANPNSIQHSKGYSHPKETHSKFLTHHQLLTGVTSLVVYIKSLNVLYSINRLSDSPRTYSQIRTNLPSEQHTPHKMSSSVLILLDLSEAFNTTNHKAHPSILIRLGILEALPLYLALSMRSYPHIYFNTAAMLIILHSCFCRSVRRLVMDGGSSAETETQRSPRCYPSLKTHPQDCQDLAISLGNSRISPSVTG